MQPTKYSLISKEDVHDGNVLVIGVVGYLILIYLKLLPGLKSGHIWPGWVKLWAPPHPWHQGTCPSEGLKSSPHSWLSCIRKTRERSVATFALRGRSRLMLVGKKGSDWGCVSCRSWEWHRKKSKLANFLGTIPKLQFSPEFYWGHGREVSDILAVWEAMIAGNRFVSHFFHEIPC